MKFGTARFHFSNDLFGVCHRRRGCMLKLPIPWLHYGPPKDGTSYRYNWDLNYRINVMMQLVALHI